MIEKLCLTCSHFNLSNQEPDWSDATPGQRFSIDCYRNHWQFDTYNSTAGDMRKYILMAQTCPDYEEAP